MRLLPVVNEDIEGISRFPKRNPRFLEKPGGRQSIEGNGSPESFILRGETICSKICGQNRNLKRHGTKPLWICVSDIHYTTGGRKKENGKKCNSKTEEIKWRIAKW
ncbi:hypothetical protein AVEN_122746-1 [Araneus ventricosus]|uniref:Uncharacterized protein n=1 Tax=Araneus ventricosus TaxID=182803 RepID=A0A4Y2ND80_ARAVE|nr:hypothetical protein AVEN_122746-1 [Araneus ventricosus]